ncbi:MAG TPA: thiol:disulfide interchange protein DsbA/DsbL [Steroidobacteraceae bacterium]|jgi:thiol:disulfide interchange protein DsbA|nr:thiol:disulfide interchange protein DsbA/DsbL [Steroidobacteraceae bacterium]HJY40983.1 thiol:disulfide interchange protein DsbA/DsbL [Steroidobacteraceae bacterium]
MTVLRILAVLLCMLAAPAYAQVENQDYKKLNPAQPLAATDQVEVIEFFSYACPHCYAMQPHIEKWAAALPKDVTFKRVPVSFGRREWGQLSRAYYALEATGDLARLDDALFDGIHKDNRPLFDEDNLAAWAGEHGVDAGKFRAAFESPGVTAQTMRAEQLSRLYTINSVPSVVVDGKYLALGKTHEEMLQIARQLVDKSTAERKTAKR